MGRPRREGLLRRLLQPEVDRYYSGILQCVQYIVATDFLRLEKVPASSTLVQQSAIADSQSQSVISSTLLAKDLASVSQAIAGGTSGAFAHVPRVELEDD